MYVAPSDHGAQMASKEPLTPEAATARRWIEEINIAEQAMYKWMQSGDVIVRRYKNYERDAYGPNATPRRRYAILYSNVETLKPAVYARTPVPIVTRRFRDADPVAKVASEVLERAVTYSLEAYNFDDRMKLARNDYLLPGRGQVWVRYVPRMRQINPEQDPELGEGQEDQDEGLAQTPMEEVAYEEVLCDHVDWKDFLTNPCREWAEVRWVARRVLMTREQLTDRFGEKGAKVPLDWQPIGYTSRDDLEEVAKRGQVYEIWDKDTRKAFWVSKSYSSDVLDERDDPLNLRDFFPCPEPLTTTQAPNEILPIPDYVQYQDQAEELDDLTARIARLQDALKVVGFYDASIKTDIQRVLAPGMDNRLVPVDTWAMFKDSGGARGAVDYFPVEMVMNVLKACYEARAQVINDIYQITGLSDIIRGDSDPNETATAQRLKGQWGSLRVRDRQKDVSRFARDIIRMKAEIIAEQFSIETLRQMTNVKLLTEAEKAQVMQIQQMMQMAQQAGLPLPPTMQPPPPEVMELMEQPTWEEVQTLLKDDQLRSFRIEIETDSTIEADEAAQKAGFSEFVTAATGLLQQAAMIVPAAPNTAPLFAEFLKEGARLFRVSRGMEDTIDKVFSQLEEQPPAQPAGPPPPDPAQQEAEAMKGQVAVMQAQNEANRTQMEGQLGMAELQMKGQELQLKAATLARDPTPQGTA